MKQTVCQSFQKTKFPTSPSLEFNLESFEVRFVLDDFHKTLENKTHKGHEKASIKIFVITDRNIEI